MKPGNLRLGLRLGLALISLSVAASCATQQQSPRASMPEPAMAAPAPVVSEPTVSRSSSRGSRVIRASYEKDAHAGHRTASGEPYDPADLTAASNTLPMGSSVVVTNPATGRSVNVRINDRSAHIRGRGLDLSKRAADEIGMTSKGVARVKIKRAESKTGISDAPDSGAVASSTSK